jgi:hypothetical protein
MSKIEPRVRVTFRRNVLRVVMVSQWGRRRRTDFVFGLQDEVPLVLVAQVIHRSASYVRRAAEKFGAYKAIFLGQKRWVFDVLTAVEVFRRYGVLR